LDHRPARKNATLNITGQTTFAGALGAAETLFSAGTVKIASYQITGSTVIFIEEAATTGSYTAVADQAIILTGTVTVAADDFI